MEGRGVSEEMGRGRALPFGGARVQSSEGAGEEG